MCREVRWPIVDRLASTCEKKIAVVCWRMLEAAQNGKERANPRGAGPRIRREQTCDRPLALSCALVVPTAE